MPAPRDQDPALGSTDDADGELDTGVWLIVAALMLVWVVLFVWGPL